jgi:hypothetical protein
MSFQTRMSVSCAETLASFLLVAADRFKEDAKLARETWPAGDQSIAKQFDKQERQARKLAEQFSEAYENDSPFTGAVPTIEEGR